jgi:hypothetical protein
MMPIATSAPIKPAMAVIIAAHPVNNPGIVLQKDFELFPFSLPI